MSHQRGIAGGPYGYEVETVHPPAFGHANHAVAIVAADGEEVAARRAIDDMLGLHRAGELSDLALGSNDEIHEHVVGGVEFRHRVAYIRLELVAAAELVCECREPDDGVCCET